MSQPQEKEPTRNRSRSKTPSIVLRVSSERELSKEPADKSVARKVPTVGTIIEESTEASQKTATTGSTTRSNRKTRIVTSDYSSSDVSPEKPTEPVVIVTHKAPGVDKSESLSQSVTTITTTTTTVETKERGKKTSTSATSVFSTTNSSSNNGKELPSPKKEIYQNEANRILEKKQAFEAISTSTPKHASSAKKVMLTPEDMKQHAAYKEYKDAGEYWNKFPKTDFTYSELSPYRREIAPGMIAMPNMSRRSLDKHSERIDTMIQRNPTQEAYIRQRYASYRQSSSGGSNVPVEAYDSQDETYMSSVSRVKKNRRLVEQQQQTIVSRFFLSIVTFCFTCIDSVRSIFRRRTDESVYYSRIEDERGFFAKVYGFLASSVISVFKRVYLFISSVLYLDAWLLQTAVTDVDQDRRKRRFLMFLLAALPFLLFGAYCLADEHQTIVLPASQRVTIALSSFAHNLPSYEHRKMDELLASIAAFWHRMPSVHWSFPWWTSKGNSAPTEAILKSVQRALSQEEYDSLIRHIDAYVDSMLQRKYEAQQQRPEPISPEVTAHVAYLIQESLQHYHYQLSQEDVEKIAEKVQLALLASHPQLFEIRKVAESTGDRETAGLSKAHIEEIHRLVSHQITINNHNFVIADQQLEDLLARILSSERLLELVDARVTLQTKDDRLQHTRQEALVESLKNELNDIKMHFTEKLAAGSLMLEDNLKLIRGDHNRLQAQLDSYRLENDEKYLKLLSDFDSRLEVIRKERYAGINKVVKENIVTILGLNVEQDLAEADLKAWISNLFVARDYLEQRLAEYQMQVNAKVREELEASAGRLMGTISEKIMQEVLVKLSADGSTKSGAGITEEAVRKIVRSALAIYDADKTGLVDYALESAGGQVLSTRCTENYQVQSAQISIFGIPLWYPTNTPRTVIAPTMQPGQCWAFTGFPGYLVIQLNTEVLVTGFSLEHISKLLSPSGRIDSATKRFSVWGLLAENDSEPILLGNYEYLDNNQSLQYFPVQNRDWEHPLRIVELRIETNHGNSRYTCLYRFRVHGEKSKVVAGV